MSSFCAAHWVPKRWLSLTSISTTASMRRRQRRELDRLSIPLLTMSLSCLVLTSLRMWAAAAGILAVEAYHAGLIRTVLWGLDQATPAAGIAATATKISNLRALLDGTGNDDIGLTTQQVALNGTSANLTASTIVNADSNTIAFSRTAQQVLNIVYASPSGTKGGFFPNGLNGNVA
jgi:hypothetical protein